MKIIDYLKKHGRDPRVIYNELGITITTRNVDGKNLYCFAYSTISSPKMNLIVRECRGLILDNDLNVICRPFDRFFNLGEALEITSKFKWEKAVCFEKKDGSLIKIYFFNKKWRIATKGTIIGDQKIKNDNNKTWHDLVFESLNIDQDTFQTKMNNISINNGVCGLFSHTFLFEITSPENRIVTPYQNSSLTLLSIINNRDGTELNEVEMSNVKDFLKVRRETVHSLKDVLVKVENLDGLEEGFVCRDTNGLRIKIKSKKWLSIFHIRSNGLVIPKRIAALILSDGDLEYLSYFPEDEVHFTEIRNNLKSWFLGAKKLWDSNKHIIDQKKFAILIKDFPLKSLLFRLKKENSGNFETEWNNSHDYIIKTLGY